jgi:hypothetical protein
MSSCRNVDDPSTRIVDYPQRVAHPTGSANEAKLLWTVTPSPRNPEKSSLSIIPSEKRFLRLKDKDRAVAGNSKAVHRGECSGAGGITVNNEFPHQLQAKRPLLRAGRLRLMRQHCHQS